MQVSSEVNAFEQCSAVYEALVVHSRDQALVYLMDKFGVDTVNQWLNWRWSAARTIH